MAYLDKHGLETFWAKIKTTFGNALGVSTSSTAVDVTLKDKATTPNTLSTATLPAATTSTAGVMSAADKTKLESIAAGAEVNVQSDWNQTDTTTDDYIKNKPDLTLKEDKSNKVTAWQTTTDDTHYPSEKLVKTDLDKKYEKPSGGIPKTDLASAVQTSLGKADTAVQDVSGKEDSANKVTSWSSTTSDTKYPSEKLVKTGLDAKYEKPSGGIPKTDLATDVQTSLGKADTAIQSHQDISGKENTSNKVTAWQTTPDNTHYPSEKLVKDYVDAQISGSTTYQGTLASEAELTALTNYKVGWYWFVSTAWTSASLGIKLDVGNMIICKTAAATYAAANFNVIQSDIEAIPDGEINALS